MSERDTLTVSFAIERRGTEFWFRKATQPGFTWHGPYLDVEEVAEMLCFYTREDLIESFSAPRDAAPESDADVQART